MDEKLSFWSWWEPAYKYFYLFLLSVFVMSAGFYLWAVTFGQEVMIGWDLQPDLESYRVLIDTFTKGFFEYSVDADTFLITERFVPNSFGIEMIGVYFSAGLVLLAMLVYLSVISEFSRTWFFAAATLFLLFIIKLDLDALVGADLDKGKIVVLSALLAYLPPCYYFYAFGTRFGFFTRLIAYSCITVLLIAVGQLFFFEVKSPMLHVAQHGYIAPLAFAMLFVAFNAHENIRAILYVVSANTAKDGGSSAILHFVVLSLFYVFNLFYYYLSRYEGVDWGLMALSPMYLFVASAFFGIWGFRRRESQYQEIFSFAPEGAFLYLSLGIVAFTTMGYAYITANDSYIQIIEQCVLFLHIGLALSFVSYVMSNFRNLIAGGYKVYRIVYQSKGILGFAGAWLLGLLVTGGFFLKNDARIVENGFSGYNISLGDLYLHDANWMLAEQYYQNALAYSDYNPRTNYALGMLGIHQNNKEAALYFFGRAAQSDRAYPQSFAQIADILLEREKFFEGVFKLEEAVKRFPESGELYNNLALTYNKTDLIDSVAVNFARAKKTSSNPDAVAANEFALWAKHSAGLDTAAVVSFDGKRSLMSDNNELVFLNKTKKTSQRGLETAYLSDSVLTGANLCYLYNYSLNKLAVNDTSGLEYIRRFSKVEANAEFAPFLKFAQAYMYYQNGRISEAVETMRWLHEDASRGNAFYAHTLGLWMMECGNFKEAATYFRIAAERGEGRAVFHRAIALSELEDKAEAVNEWVKLRVGDGPFAAIAQEMIDLLSPSNPGRQARFALKETPDNLKYKYLHYNNAVLADADFDKIASNISDKNYLGAAGLSRAQYYIDKNDAAKAKSLLDKLPADARDEYLLRELFVARVKIAAMTSEMPEALKDNIQKVNFPRGQKAYSDFAQALYVQSKGDSAVSAALFSKTLSGIPFEKEAYIAYARFFDSKKDSEKAYLTLHKGIRAFPESEGLLQAYILKCLDLTFVENAETALEALKAVAPPENYEAFMKTYQEKKAKMEAMLLEWQQ